MRLVLSSLLTLATALPAASYYVSPLGNDAALGSAAAPFKTLAKAAAAAQAGDTVYLRQGVYRETLTAVRSGAAGAPIVFRGAAGESAVLAGSDLVTGAWAQHSGNIWRIDGLPATWSVYVDGVEMVEARWPNAAPGSAMTAGWATADTGSSSTHLADSALPALNLNGAKVRVIPGAAWVAYSRTVTNYSAGNGFDFDTSVGPNTSYWPTAGNQYHLYRHLALLDSAGEWYQDPATQRLYLWVPGGGDPGAHTVEIARRKAVVSVSAFNYLELRDLFTYSGWVSFSNSSGSKVVNVHQRYIQRNNDVDGYNFELTHNELNGGSGGEWSGGSIDSSSGDGLYLAGTGHTVKDMVIHNVDLIGNYKGAVRMAGSNHTVTRNTFYDSGRFLIFHDQAKGGSLTYNHLYNAGLLTKDLGATYCYRCNGGGMVIAYNHVHDVHCEVGAGIYLDNGGSNFRIHHNLVHDVDWFALKLNLPSYDNLVVNNTLYATKYWVNAAGSQYAQEMTGTALVNNLYSGGAKLITGAMGPSLITNGSYTAPPAIFNSGAWTLASGSPAIDKGTFYTPYGDIYCGAKPDQGCFESACGTPWSAGTTLTPPAFPYPFPSVGTATPTPSRTATRTASPSATRTATPSASPSATRSASPTATPSRSATASPTASATPSRTPSPPATLSGSPSATGSASPSGTPSSSATVSPSGTPSTTPGTSAAATPSGTQSPRPSVSVTRTPSPTETAGPSGTMTVTLSPSPSATGSGTASASPTGTASSSASPTTSATPSVTPSATLSATATASPSSTRSATVSVTLSPSSSSSPTASPAPSPLATATGTRTPTVTPSSTPSPSPLPSASATAVASTGTPIPEAGILRIREAVALPNPVQNQLLRLRYFSEAAAFSLQLRVYDPASICELAQDLPGPAAPGWSQAEVQLPGLAPGYYSAQLRLRDGSRISEPKLLKVWVLP